MVVLAKGPGEEKEQNHLCREKVKIEVAGRTHRLYAMHDWGACATLITHAAASHAGLAPIRHSARVVAGVGGKGVESTCYYVVPLVDRDDEVQTIRATGVTRITKAPATKLPADMRKQFPMIGQVARLEHPGTEIDLLIGLDNQRWMAKHEDSSRMAGDNLRLMYSSLSRTLALIQL
jgi:hypothetical protein